MSERKQLLEKAKASHLSKQLQMRLRYARLKVDHGWQKQTLNEVENLYFHHSSMRNPTKPFVYTKPSLLAPQPLQPTPQTQTQPPTTIPPLNPAAQAILEAAIGNGKDVTHQPAPSSSEPPKSKKRKVSPVAAEPNISVSLSDTYNRANTANSQSMEDVQSQPSTQLQSQSQTQPTQIQSQSFYTYTPSINLPHSSSQYHFPSTTTPVPPLPLNPPPTLTQHQILQQQLAQHQQHVVEQSRSTRPMDLNSAAAHLHAQAQFDFSTASQTQSQGGGLTYDSFWNSVSSSVTSTGNSWGARV